MIAPVVGLLAVVVLVAAALISAALREIREQLELVRAALAQKAAAPLVVKETPRQTEQIAAEFIADSKASASVAEEVPARRFVTAENGQKIDLSQWELL